MFQMTYTAGQVQFLDSVSHQHSFEPFVVVLSVDLSHQMSIVLPFVLYKKKFISFLWKLFEVFKINTFEYNLNTRILLSSI